MQMTDKKSIHQELQNNDKIKECCDRFGTTGDPTRMKICFLLCHHPELSVSEIAELLNAHISTVSHSLKKLKAIHVVINRRKAKEVLYSLNKSSFTDALKSQLLAKTYD